MATNQISFKIKTTNVEFFETLRKQINRSIQKGINLLCDQTAVFF